MAVKWEDVKDCWDSVELYSKLDNLDFEFVLQRVRYGVEDDARIFLLACAVCLEEGEWLPYSFIAFLADRFKEMALATDPFDVSLLKRQRGQKGAQQLDRDAELALEVRELINAKGMNILDAARAVSRKRTAAAAAGEKVSSMPPERTEKVYRRYFANEKSPRSRAAFKEKQKPRPEWMTDEVLTEIDALGKDQWADYLAKKLRGEI